MYFRLRLGKNKEKNNFCAYFRKNITKFIFAPTPTEFRLRKYMEFSEFERYCPANSKKGQYLAQIICAGKLEAHLFFFLNFKGKSSQEEHKIIFSG